MATTNLNIEGVGGLVGKKSFKKKKGKQSAGKKRGFRSFGDIFFVANITLHLVSFQNFPWCLSQILNPTSPQNDVCAKNSVFGCASIS